MSKAPFRNWNGTCRTFWSHVNSACQTSSMLTRNAFFNSIARLAQGPIAIEETKKN